MSCQALDGNGKQCKGKIVNYIRYHGDSEIYEYHFEHDDFDIKWVVIGVCKKHYRENFDKDSLHRAKK